MQDIDRNFKGTALPSACLAPDGSGGGAPRDEDPRRSGLDLGEMLDMGLESLLMHFRRRRPDRPRDETATSPDRSDD